MTYLGQTLARDPGRSPSNLSLSIAGAKREWWLCSFMRPGGRQNILQGLRSVQAHRGGPEVSVWGPRHPWGLLSQGILGAEVLRSQGQRGGHLWLEHRKALGWLFSLSYPSAEQLCKMGPRTHPSRPLMGIN